MSDMSIFDPPSDPYGQEKTCLYCDYPLMDKGFSRFHDWVCTNPKCDHSPCYENIDEDLEIFSILK